MASVRKIKQAIQGEEGNYSEGFGVWDGYVLSACMISFGIFLGIAAGMMCVFYFISIVFYLL